MPRFEGRLEQLNTLFTDIRRPEYTQETPAVQRRNHKKKTTIKQLFTATSKFQKNLRRGVFLACLLYHEDKVLVTNEDFLPVIEIDETYPSCIYNDFHWLMKVACTWDDVKSLRQDMEKSHSSSTNHFKIKLLQAAAQMQVRCVSFVQNTENLNFYLTQLLEFMLLDIEEYPMTFLFVFCRLHYAYRTLDSCIINLSETFKAP